MNRETNFARHSAPISRQVPGEWRTNFARWIREYGERAYQFAYRLTGNVEQSRDLVQETFRRALACWSQYDPDRPPESWLLGILHGAFLDGVRRYECRFTVSIDAPRYVEDARSHYWGEDVSDGKAELLSDMESSEGLEMVRRAYARLGSHHRAALKWCDMEGLRYAHIARLLECPLGTVRSRIHRARKALRAMVEPYFCADADFRSAPAIGSDNSPSKTPFEDDRPRTLFPRAPMTGGTWRAYPPGTAREEVLLARGKENDFRPAAHDIMDRGTPQKHRLGRPSSPPKISFGDSRPRMALPMAKMFSRAMLDTPEKVARGLDHLCCLRKEHVVAMYMDARNRELRRETVSIGTLTASLIHPREVFASAIVCSAAGVVVAHNHPSGDQTPSPEDRDITRRLAKAGEILGIPLLDHVIVARDGFFSFRSSGLI